MKQVSVSVEFEDPMQPADKMLLVLMVNDIFSTHAHSIQLDERIDLNDDLPDGVKQITIYRSE